MARFILWCDTQFRWCSPQLVLTVLYTRVLNATVIVCSVEVSLLKKAVSLFCYGRHHERKFVPKLNGFSAWICIRCFHGWHKMKGYREVVSVCPLVSSPKLFSGFWLNLILNWYCFVANGIKLYYDRWSARNETSERKRIIRKKFYTKCTYVNL